MDLIEGQSQPVWLDGNPFWLMIALDDGRIAKIDLGESGWIGRYGEQGYLRDPGRWFLVRKGDHQIQCVMLVHEGEQPYYVARHVGSTSSSGETSETTVYGIGKKRLDGHVDRYWIAANGSAMIGEDESDLALWMLRNGHV